MSPVAPQPHVEAAVTDERWCGGCSTWNRELDRGAAHTDNKSDLPLKMEMHWRVERWGSMLLNPIDDVSEQVRWWKERKRAGTAQDT